MRKPSRAVRSPAVRPPAGRAASARSAAVHSPDAVLDGPHSPAHATTTPRRGRPPDTAKRAAVVLAAQDLFTERGLGGTSMEAIAERAGVSKLTVYNQFGNKQEIFRAAIVAKCDEMMAPLDAEAAKRLPARAALTLIGRVFLGLILSPEATSMMRLLGEERLPELTDIFYRNAVQRTNEQIADVLAHFAAQGTLQFDDPMLAAWDFLSLVKGKPQMCLQIGMPAMPAAAVEQHLAHCVEFALRAWAPVSVARAAPPSTPHSKPKSARASTGR
jgi:TetR/AcrR family transcriptional regulator, mexJK operon transcriptional repressor